LIGEVEPDRRLDGLGFSGRLQVHVEYKIRVRVDLPSHALGLFLDCGTGLPEQEVAVRVEAAGLDCGIHAVEARRPVLAVPKPGSSFSVDQHIRMVNGAGGAWANLHGPYESSTVDRGPQDEVSKHVG